MGVQGAEGLLAAPNPDPGFEIPQEGAGNHCLISESQGMR
jgi:hypothetical protein